MDQVDLQEAFLIILIHVVKPQLPAHRNQYTPVPVFIERGPPNFSKQLHRNHACGACQVTFDDSDNDIDRCYNAAIIYLIYDSYLDCV